MSDPAMIRIHQEILDQWKLPASMNRNEDIQQKVNRGQTRRRFWCLIIFLLLLTTYVIIFEGDLRQVPLTWSYGLWKGAQQTAASESTARITSGSYDQYFVEYPHEYHFIINESERCKQRETFLALMVPVAPHDRAARDTIRSTWGNESLILGKVVNLFFLLGLPKGDRAQQVQEQVLKESREHRDLLQSDFLDCYKNLTIKTMVMMEWLDSHCSSASYAMKIDSDMFLNTHNLVNMLLTAQKLNYMTGLVASEAPVLRDPNSKWYLPVEVFPESHYPRYALGLGYVFSLDLPRKLVEASRHVKAVYIEDVYVGLCMRQLGIPPTNPPNWNQFHVYPVSYSRCAYSMLIATTTNPDADQVSAWKDFRRPGPFCEYGVNSIEGNQDRNM